MQQTFELDLAEEEKAFLLAIVRNTIGAELGMHNNALAVLPPMLQQGVLHEQLGAFVTLKVGEALRGCIGNLVADEPLYKVVARMAHSAAFEDPRFKPVTAHELPHIRVEISVMGPITQCKNTEDVVIGRHGLIVRKGNRQGLLLPQVPVEWGWDRETFLSQTCRKAQLPPDAWRDPQTEIYWFEAVVFGEHA